MNSRRPGELNHRVQTSGGQIFGDILAYVRRRGLTSSRYMLPDNLLIQVEAEIPEHIFSTFILPVEYFKIYTPFMGTNFKSLKLSTNVSHFPVLNITRLA